MGHPILDMNLRGIEEIGSNLNKNYTIILHKKDSLCQVVFPCSSSHLCPVMNLADAAYGMRNKGIEREIPVLARGKNQ